MFSIIKKKYLCIQIISVKEHKKMFHLTNKYMRCEIAVIIETSSSAFVDN